MRKIQKKLEKLKYSYYNNKSGITLIALVIMIIILLIIAGIMITNVTKVLDKTNTIKSDAENAAAYEDLQIAYAEAVDKTGGTSGIADEIEEILKEYDENVNVSETDAEVKVDDYKGYNLVISKVDEKVNDDKGSDVTEITGAIYAKLYYYEDGSGNVLFLSSNKNARLNEQNVNLKENYGNINGTEYNIEYNAYNYSDLNYKDSITETKSDGTIIIYKKLSASTNLPPWLETEYKKSKNGLQITYTESIASNDIIKVVINDEISPNYMRFFFAYLTELTEIEGIKNIKLSNNVTSLTSLFDNCKSIKSIDLSGLDTSNVTSMMMMFNNCKSLQSIIGINELKTSNVTNMYKMFQSCNTLSSSISLSLVSDYNDIGEKELNLSNWDVSKVTNMGWIFAYCNSLKNIDLTNWNISSATNLYRMFYYNTSLTNIYGSITNGDGLKLQNMQEMLSDCNSLKSVDFLNELKTQNVTNMYGLFCSCKSLTQIDFSSNFNTQKVITMSKMFYSCVSLTSLDLSKFEGSELNNMYAMFGECKALEELNLTTFNKTTSIVTNMDQMFYNCTQLNKIIGIENLNTSTVTKMNQMFYNCQNLLELNLSKWITDNLKSLSSTFAICGNLKSLNVSTWCTTGTLVNMNATFAWCGYLEDLDVSGWDTSNVTDMASTFKGLAQSVAVGTTVTLNLSKWDTSNVLYMNCMFQRNVATADNGCTDNTMNIILGNWETDKVIEMDYMFFGSSITDDMINFKSENGNWNVSNVRLYELYVWRLQKNNEIRFKYMECNINKNNKNVFWMLKFK